MMSKRKRSVSPTKGPKLEAPGDHDKMAISIYKYRTTWKSSKTEDIIVPQSNFPRITLHVPEELTGVFFFNDKLKVVTCGRQLKSMLPTSIFDYHLPRFERLDESGILYDGERFFIKTDGSRLSFEEGIKNVLDYFRLILKRNEAKIYYLSSGAQKYLASTLEDVVGKRQHVTNYIVTGKETTAFKDEGGIERLNAIGQRKVYKGTLKGERGLDDKYASTDNMEKVDMSRLNKKRKKEQKKILQHRRETVKKCLHQLSAKTTRRPTRKIVYSSEEEGEAQIPQSSLATRTPPQGTSDIAPLTSTPVQVQAGPSRTPPSGSPPNINSPHYVIAVLSSTELSSDDDLDQELIDQSLIRERDIPPFEEDDILATPEWLSSKGLARLDFLLDYTRKLGDFILNRDPEKFAYGLTAKRVLSITLELVHLLRSLYGSVGKEIPADLVDPTTMEKAIDLCHPNCRCPFRYSHLSEVVGSIMSQGSDGRHDIVKYLHEMSPSDSRQSVDSTSEETTNLVCPVEGHLIKVPVTECHSPSDANSSIWPEQEDSPDDVVERSYFQDNTPEAQQNPESPNRRDRFSVSNLDPRVDPKTGICITDVCKKRLESLRTTNQRKQKVEKLKNMPRTFLRGEELLNLLTQQLQPDSPNESSESDNNE